MKSVQVNTLLFKNLNYTVASDADEYDRLAKKVGACVDSANNNTIYRSTLADFRYNFLHGVEAVGVEGDENFRPGIPGFDKITGIERNTRETGKFRGEGELKEPIVVWDETEVDYFKRALAELVKKQSTVEIDGTTFGPFASIEAAAEAFTSLAQRHLDAIPFDPSETEKKPAGPKKIAAIYVAVAKKLVAAGRAEAAAAELSSKLGITVLPTEDSLSRAISEDQRREREQVGAKYGV
jgi:hypothetical protein